LLADGGTVKSAEQLCLACGLCCDGSLFDHVQLGPGDEAKKLKALGLTVSVSRGATPIARFRQPCTALCADRTCRVYADRPGQCRSFECGVFKDAQAGRIEFSAALRLVKQARRRVDKVRQLLRELGDTDEQRSLNERFRRTQQRMEAGLADAAAGETFAELGQAMHHLNLLAFDKFYTKAEVPTKR
jgi:Fe-S-cluster containining protein